MSLLPIMKKCPKCGRKYSWNPDVGKFYCPKCGNPGGAKPELSIGPDSVFSIGGIECSDLTESAEKKR